MKSFSTDQPCITHVLQMDYGEDLLESVNAFIVEKGIQNGVVVSGIATFYDCVMHMVETTGFPPVEYFDKRVDKPIELAAVQGVIADGVPHLHMVISNKDQAFAGHVEPGCKILYLCELVIQEFVGLNLTRVMGDKGIKKLVEKE